MQGKAAREIDSVLPEVEDWKKKEPLIRLRAYLTKKGLWSDEIEARVTEEQMKLIDSEVEIAESFKPDPKTMFQSVYSFMPDVLSEEMKDAQDNSYWQGE